MQILHVLAEVLRLLNRTAGSHTAGNHVAILELVHAGIDRLRLHALVETLVVTLELVRVLGCWHLGVQAAAVHGIGLYDVVAAGKNARMTVRPAERNLSLGSVGRCGLPRSGSRSAGVIRRHLGLNAAAVGSVADCRENRADCLDKAMLLVRGGVVQSSLHNIVAVRVPHKTLHLLGMKHLFDYYVFRCRLGTA